MEAAASSSSGRRRAGRSAMLCTAQNDIPIEQLPPAEQNFFRKCLKFSWIDGRFFKVLIAQSSAKDEHVTAKCMTCDGEIKGKYNVSSNFFHHLKVIKIMNY